MCAEPGRNGIYQYLGLLLLCQLIHTLVQQMAVLSLDTC